MQCGCQVCRAPDRKCGGPKFKSSSDYQLGLFQVVAGSIPGLHLCKFN